MLILPLSNSKRQKQRPTLNNPPRRKRTIGLWDRPKSEKVKMKKMILLWMRIKKKVNKSGKTQERGSILVRNTNPNKSRQDPLIKITLGAKSKLRHPMNA